MTDNLQATSATESITRQPYAPPAIVHELKLETRAGSTLAPALTDPLGIDPTKPQGN